MNERDVISSNAANDDMRHYAFERTSGIPYGYFGRARSHRLTHWTFAFAGALGLLIVITLVVEFVP